MAKFKATHTGTWQSGRGNATCPVQLRETSKFWIDQNGRKYRKVYGSVPGDSFLSLGLLLIDSIKRLPPKFAHVGQSIDGRTNRWRVECTCGKAFCPPTTIMGTQSFSCPHCEANYVADWNKPEVNYAT